MKHQTDIDYRPGLGLWRPNVLPKDAQTIKLFIALTEGCSNSYLFMEMLETRYALNENEMAQFVHFYPVLLETIYSQDHLKSKGFDVMNRDIINLLSKFPLPQALKQTRKWNRREMKKRFRF